MIRPDRYVFCNRVATFFSISLQMAFNAGLAKTGPEPFQPSFSAFFFFSLNCKTVSDMASHAKSFWRICLSGAVRSRSVSKRLPFFVSIIIGIFPCRSFSAIIGDNELNSSKKPERHRQAASFGFFCYGLKSGWFIQPVGVERPPVQRFRVLYAPIRWP